MNNSNGPTEALPRQQARSTRLLPWIFLVLGTTSGIWVLGARGGFPTWQGFPNTAVTSLFFLGAAATVARPVPSRHRWGVVAGLLFSALGDLFLLLPQDRFVAGLTSFLAAHLCYLWAFTGDHRLAQRPLSFALWGVAGLVLLPWLWPGIAGPLRLPVVVYTAALLAMAAQAAGRAYSHRNLAAVMAAAGAALFVASDALLAIQRFRHPLEGGRLWVLGTYFAAQAGIALSVVLFRRPTPNA